MTNSITNNANNNRRGRGRGEGRGGGGGEQGRLIRARQIFATPPPMKNREGNFTNAAEKRLIMGGIHRWAGGHTTLCHRVACGRVDSEIESPRISVSRNDFSPTLGRLRMSTYATCPSLESCCQWYISYAATFGIPGNSEDIAGFGKTRQTLPKHNNH
jgi:hypothetical protein